MKHGQNGCLDEISDRFENGSCWVKTRSVDQILGKPCVCSRGHIFSQIIVKLGQNVVLIKFWTSLKIGCVGSKTRSLGQILEKPCVHSKGPIFSPIIMKRGQNVCLNKISDKFVNGSCQVKNKVTRSCVRKTLCTL